MIATEIFRRNHRTIQGLVSLDRALLMETPNWAIVARALANYLRSSSGNTGVRGALDFRTAGTDRRMQPAWSPRGSRNTGTWTLVCTSSKALTKATIGAELAPLVREKGVALVKEFLHHMFLKKRWASRWRKNASVSKRAQASLLLKEAEKGLEEPAAID
jgi:hypothetical protein